jgi:hypothetical protein
VTRVVFVTDIVTPYMVAVFRALAKVVDLKVVFCAAAGARGNPWEFGELDFDHAIVDGLARTRPDAMSLYVSPRIATTIARARPRAVIWEALRTDPVCRGLLRSRPRAAVDPQ